MSPTLTFLELVDPDHAIRSNSTFIFAGDYNPT